MARYRKKPVEIEAVQLTEENKDQVFNDMTGQFAPVFVDGDPAIKFRTMHGEEAIARIGDWIVEDGKPGTYYPVKPDVFAATYEPVE